MPETPAESDEAKWRPAQRSGPIPQRRPRNRELHMQEELFEGKDFGVSSYRNNFGHLKLLIG